MGKNILIVVGILIALTIVIGPGYYFYGILKSRKSKNNDSYGDVLNDKEYEIEEEKFNSIANALKEYDKKIVLKMKVVGGVQVVQLMEFHTILVIIKSLMVIITIVQEKSLVI
ncbi:MAG TPA: hypothetical protein PK957_03215 [Candidatus Dojkabacteria bacterium]|nr:hypothetical protein [Candidatus Dojkabacteria bacterium]HQF37091.1 hypothetical protein [Candidatus Dojkabacteria bacterium]